MEQDAIGNLILRVNDDLNRLQENLNNRQNQDKLDVGDIKEILSNAQNGFHKRAEYLLSHISNQPASFTNLNQFIGNDSTSTSSPIPREYLERIQNISLKNEKEIPFLPVQHVSPGELSKRNLALRSLADPDSRLNRTYAHEKMGIQLPLIETKKPIKFNPYDSVQKGSMVKKTEHLPLEINKHYNQQTPARIMETDASKGLYSLIERGLIPPNARITLDPPPINHEPINPIPDMPMRLRHTYPATASDQGFSTALYHLDETNATTNDYLNDDEENNSTNNGISTLQRAKLRQQYQKPVNQLYDESRFARNRKNKFSTTLDAVELITESNEQPQKPIIQYRNNKNTRRRSSASKAKSTKNLKFNEDVNENNDKKLVPMPNQIEREETKPPATTPASLFSKSHMDSVHKFTIKDGHTRENADDFILFKKHYCLSWGGIITIIQYLEAMLQKYSVPIAFIDGDSTADLSVEFELSQKPTEDDLLNCVINRRDVWALIKQPGRRFVGEHGRTWAATTIQSKWRSYTERKKYLEFRRKRWAAGVIAIKWILHMKMNRVKLELQKTRETHVINYQKRFGNLSKRWPTISTKRRVVIHIPSLGLPESMRSKIKHLPELQNHQMTRLCDLKDPNVDVVYISPVLVNDELLQYYSKLFALKSAVDTGNSDNQTQINSRYRIIVPEAIKSFPNHNMCLSTLLKYSPRALARIRSMIHGRTAYIVPGLANIDDLDVADQLDCPILGTEPSILHAFTSKSGIRKIIKSAKVETAPGDESITSLVQLQESLANLITNNLSMKRWILKINNAVYGQGLAYIEIDKHLKCYSWAQKEQKRYGEKWSKGWAQESAYNRILGEIPGILDKFVIPNDAQRYPNAQKFFKEYFKQGGIVEGYPGSDSVTNITVSMLLDPTGKPHILSSGDQIHDGNFLRAWGYSAPQSSIEAEILNKRCQQIAEICKLKSIRGYFSIDFVTFLEETQNMETEENQRLWAVDIDFQYSDMEAMFNLAQFSANIQFNSADHVITNIINKEATPEPLINRYVCMSTQLSHSNLSMVHYSVFFQMCRAHGIGYDVKEKQGSIFSLIDSFNRENIGMISVGPNLEGTLETFAKNLHVLHQEISSPNMPGKGNFQAVIKEIEGILGLVIENVVQNSTSNSRLSNK